MNGSDRPDPDALLADLQEETARSEGRLKIFLGMCPGVGKTYSMLLAGQVKQEEGVSVVIGIVETHGRVETLAVSAGIPRIPRKQFTHRGVTLEEMDLDAILERKPELVLVDELAHSNAAGSRHPKRWQDVVELLKAGIDVYTTLNVQHIESYRDVVRQITGAPVNETVADSLLDRADEVELVDVTAEQLRKRLEEGKVYLGERAVAAASNFFKEGNLKALREIALRITADRADQDVRRFRSSRRITTPWRSRERLLVAVGGSPFSEHLIRIARRAAAAVHAPWIAVYVDTGTVLDTAATARLESNLNLARSMGAEVVMTTGQSVEEALLRVGREHNVSQIVVGKPIVHPFTEWIRGGSIVSRLIRQSGEIDVYVVRADKTAAPWRPVLDITKQVGFWREVGIGLAIVAGTTVAGLLLQPTIGHSAVGLLYLLAVLLGATTLSQGPILITAALTACAWNFLFIPPTFTLFIRSAHDIILFGMYFVVALVIGHLHSRLRQRERAERRREQQAVAFSQFTRALTESPDLTNALASVSGRLKEIFASEISISLANPEEELTAATGTPLNEREAAVAAWVLGRREVAGRFTNTLPQAAGFHLPLQTPSRAVGVLSVFPPSNVSLSLAERQMLETFAAHLALVVEQYRLRGEAEQMRVEEKSRALQKTLLDSVSHELKTPLAVISAASDSLRHATTDSRTLLNEIDTAVLRLERVLGNLLDMTRIETGSIRPKLVWCDLHEVVASALDRVQEEMGPRPVTRKLPDEAIRVDSGLLEEVLVNLLRNAAQNSPADSTIALDTTLTDNQLTLRVIDEGPGMDGKDTERLFGKFERGSSAKAGGLGLGLSIVKGLSEAMGGAVTAHARADGKSGAEFRISLPVAVRDIRAFTA